MDKDKPKIHYCTILSDEQWDFILEGRFSVQRQRCLHRLMTNAVRTKTVCNIKGIGIALEVVDSFNRLGVLTTRTNNRTSIHTLHFLTGWYVGGVLMTNPHYVKPSANAKEQADGTRTPNHNEMLPQNVQCSVPDNRQCGEQETDTTASGAAALSFSLCSSVCSDHSADKLDSEENSDHPYIIGKEDAMPDGNHAESHKEAQDGTIDGVDDTDTGTGI